METGRSLSHATIRSTTEMHFQGDPNAAQRYYHGNSKETHLCHHENYKKKKNSDAIIQIARQCYRTNYKENGNKEQVGEERQE
jgi:hypothetical protein